jgi:4-amino-4-deoxy-L-arabinose transferase-like glycosyltransferase
VAIPTSLLTPALSNNDETYHIQYALYLRTHHSLPEISVANGDESQQPPLYYISLAAWMKLLGMPEFSPSLPTEPATAANLIGFDHVYTTPTQRQMAVDVHLLRLPGIGYGLVTVLAAFGSAWVLTRRVSIASATASAVALWPKFIVVAASVSNESMTDAFCALALLVLLLWLRAERRRIRWAGVAGLLLGLAVITKFTALPVAGLLLLLVVVRSVIHRWWRDPLLAVAAFAAVSGWWLVRNTVLYGDPLAASATLHFLNQFIAHLVVPSFNHSLSGYWIPWLVNSVWYQGGANQLTLPWDLAVAVSILALPCLGWGAWVVWRHWRTAPSSRLDLPLLGLAAVAAVAGWVVLCYQITQAPARYLLVSISAWAVLLVAGTDHITVLPRAVRRAAVWLWPLVFAGLDVYVFAQYLIPHGGF